MLDVLLINVFPSYSIFLLEEWLQENEDAFLLYINIKSLADQLSARKKKVLNMWQQFWKSASGFRMTH